MTKTRLKKATKTVYTILKQITRWVPRSRPSRPNDNCRVEQKNGSILRAWLGETRLDDRSLEPALHELARRLSLYHNLFVPCKKLLSKTPGDKLHTSYKHVYDKPKTPLERCRESGLCDAGRIAELENLRDKINVIHLVAKIKSLVKTVVDNANNARGAAGLAPQPSPPASVSRLLTNAAPS